MRFQGVDYNFMVEVLCKQLSHRYVCNAICCNSRELTNWKSMFDSNYFEEFRYLQTPWRTAEKRSVELDRLFDKFTTKASNYVVMIT